LVQRPVRTSIVTTLHRRKPLEVAHSKRDRGWANPGNWKEPAPSSERMGVARLAVRHRSRKGGPAWRIRQGRRLRPPSQRESGVPVGLPARRNETLLQKSVGGVWPQIRSAYALQKERQGRVNGGLARRDCRRDERRRGRRAKRRRESGCIGQYGARPTKAQDDARASSSGRFIVKNGVTVVGLGL
jgi:hypothetical protein